MTAAELGYVYLHSGRVSEALPLLEQAVHQSRRGLLHLLHRSWLAEACFLANQLTYRVRIDQRLNSSWMSAPGIRRFLD